MFVFANFISAGARVLDALLTVYMYIIIARAIVSWVNPDPYNPIVRFLYQATEPVIGRVRRLLPFMGGLDVSPIVVILAIYFIQWFVVSTLLDVAFKLKVTGTP